MRQQCISNRTALANQLWGLLLEYGVSIAIGVARLRESLLTLLDNEANELTPMMRELCWELYEELRILDEKNCLGYCG